MKSIFVNNLNLAIVRIPLVYIRTNYDLFWFLTATKRLRDFFINLAFGFCGPPFKCWPLSLSILNNCELESQKYMHGLYNVYYTSPKNPDPEPDFLPKIFGYNFFRTTSKTLFLAKLSIWTKTLSSTLFTCSNFIKINHYSSYSG